jgi:hypothetical protein
MRIKKSKAEALQDIVEHYRQAGEPWPATAKDIAYWAIRHHEWVPQPKSQAEECARELADAMREQFFVDEHGHHVRQKHALRKTELLPDGKQRQLTLWVDIHDAQPEEMHVAFQQRRGQILNDCVHLKTDADWYNEHNPHEVTIPLLFDFSEDLVELDEPAEYGAGPQEDTIGSASSSAIEPARP